MGSAPVPGSAGGAVEFPNTSPRPSPTVKQEVATPGSFDSNRRMHGDSLAQDRSDQEEFSDSAAATSSAGGAQDFSDTEPSLSPTSGPTRSLAVGLGQKN